MNAADEIAWWRRLRAEHEAAENWPAVEACDAEIAALTTADLVERASRGGEAWRVKWTD